MLRNVLGPDSLCFKIFGDDITHAQTVQIASFAARVLRILPQGDGSLGSSCRPGRACSALSNARRRRASHGEWRRRARY